MGWNRGDGHHHPGAPLLPFKANQHRRRRVPRRHRVTDWPADDAAPRARASLMVWFSEEAIAAGAAEPRTTME